MLLEASGDLSGGAGVGRDAELFAGVPYLWGGKPHAGRGQERSDVVYSEITKVATVPRGLGLWGDMVLTLKDGSRLEMRSVPNFRELADYINERIAEKQTAKAKAAPKASKKAA